MAGTLFVVATPIGNLEDITARALRVLREVSIIAAEDTRRTANLLSRYGITTPTTSLHEHNEQQKTSTILSRLESGESVALVSDAGTPTVSDPGRHLISAASERGLRVEAVPGPSALIAALSVSGLATLEFTYLGFPPIKAKDRIEWMRRLAQASPTAVFYESPHRILNTLAEVKDRIGDVYIVVARELTKAHEELVKGPISVVLTHIAQPRGEFTVVVDIGHSPDKELAGVRERVTDIVIADEFRQLTASGAATRRQAIATLARRHARTAKEVYSAIERAKSSGG